MKERLDYIVELAKQGETVPRHLLHGFDQPFKHEPRAAIEVSDERFAQIIAACGSTTAPIALQENLETDQTNPSDQV